MLTDQQRDLLPDAVHVALHEVFIKDPMRFSIARVRDVIRNRRYLDKLELLEDDDVQLVIETSVEAETTRLAANSAVPRFEEVEPVADRRQWAGRCGT